MTYIRPRKKLKGFKHVLPFAFFTVSLLAGGLPAWAEISAEVLASAQQRVELGLNPALVIVYLEKGKAPEIKALGSTSLEPGASAVTPQTLFEIGSVSKTFTALAAALQVEQGLMKVDDSLDSLWPQSWGPLNPSLAPIKLSALLTHTSGLPRMPDNFQPADPNDPYADYAQNQLQAFLKGLKLQNAPPKYGYSNLAYGLTGALLAARAGNSYSQLITRDILQPLGMLQSRLDDPPATESLALPHYEGVPVAPWHFSEPTAGAGAIRSSGQDMAKYLSAQLSPPAGPLGKAIQRSHQLLHTESELELAYGWHVARVEGQPLYWHNGQTGGFLSFMGFMPDKGVGAVVLTNNTDSIQDLGLRLLNPAQKLWPVFDKRLPERQLKVYTGTYNLAPGMDFTITQAHGYLLVQLTGQPALRVFPIDQPHRFAYRVVDAQLAFDTDDQGQVKGLTLHQNGMTPYAKKHP